MSYTIEQIVGLLEAEPLNRLHRGPLIEQLLIDSRRSLSPENSLFFAFRGAAADGADFIAELYRRGCRHFVVDRPPDRLPSLPEANILLVNDTLQALQRLARAHRASFQLPVLGITGSNGKTIVKEWLFQLLDAPSNVLRTPGSINSQIGVSLAIWPLHKTHELAILEAGISQPGEMDRLAKIIQPTLGLITNIGEAHSEAFPSRREKLREKLRLFQDVEMIFYCADHVEIREEVRRLGLPATTWSRQPGSPVQLLQQEPTATGTRLVIRRGEDHFELNLPFRDPASIENAMHCLNFLLFWGVEPSVLARRVPRLEPVALRLQVKEGIHGCTLVDDSYNADLQGLENALFVLEQQAADMPRTLILSDFLQSGLPDDQLYGRAAELLLEHRINRLIGVGPHIPAIRNSLPESMKATFFPDTQALLRVLDRLPFDREAILVKGARMYAFERIVRRLERRRSRTTLEINLDALAHNLLAFHGQLRPDTKMMAMVKASAYGGGSLEIARRLAFHGVDYLAVAYLDEGVELREGGITTPIMVLNPDPEAFDLLSRYRLQPEVFSLELLSALGAFAHRIERELPVHINLNTGMNRLGFSASHLPALIEGLRSFPELEVRSVFSHLSASDDPAEDAFTHRQAQTFQSLYAELQEALGFAPLRHLLNTAGMVRFPEYQFDMVRLGLGLYGVGPKVDATPALQPVFHFHAHISQILEVDPGESVGYGRRGRSSRARRIGTITAGYADGLPLGAGLGRFSVRVRGRPAPTVGSVCMDMTMIDLSEIPDARVGDRVDLFGQAPSVEELADACQSIPYAIFTGISPRVKRIYLQES